MGAQQGKESSSVSGSASGSLPRGLLGPSQFEAGSPSLGGGGGGGGLNNSDTHPPKNASRIKGLKSRSSNSGGGSRSGGGGASLPPMGGPPPPGSSPHGTMSMFAVGNEPVLGKTDNSVAANRLKTCH